MKFIYIFLVILFCSIMVKTQVNLPKQLTNFEFDSRNPVFLLYPLNMPWYYSQSELFFEAVYNDSLISICLLKYNTAQDSFYQFTILTPVVDSNTIHRNAAGRFVENYPEMPYKLLIWETNLNGNWDIAVSIDSGNGWATYSLLFSSPEDELNPSFVYDPLGYNYQVKFQLLYSKGNSVYFCTQTDSLRCELLFEGNDSVKYSDPAGAYADYDGNLYAVAVEVKNSKRPQLVYRLWNQTSGTWGDIKTVFDRSPSVKPQFVNPGWGEVYLSFEALGDSIKKNLLIRPADFGVTGTAITLMSDQAAETTDFSSFTFGIITEHRGDDFYTSSPFAFRFRRSDSTYIRAGLIDSFEPYTDIYTKVIDSKPALGPLRIIFEGVVSYTVWEDSSNERINLFGLKRIDPLGEVENEESSLREFSLSQNYPNPFNPSTSIEYKVGSSEYVTLKVYDVLGREVAKLVNEEKQPGVYEVEFNANGLASGIYYYQLKAGSYIETKKMMITK